MTTELHVLKIYAMKTTTFVLMSPTIPDAIFVTKEDYAGQAVFAIPSYLAILILPVTHVLLNQGVLSLVQIAMTAIHALWTYATKKTMNANTSFNQSQVLKDHPAMFHVQMESTTIVTC